ncbi:MAG TPA: hypothetical protein VMU99_09575 [Acidimicrobiales bacterium]|nr:hypothetical protein [Acidimicrobiales bacterium]
MPSDPSAQRPTLGALRRNGLAEAHGLRSVVGVVAACLASRDGGFDEANVLVREFLVDVSEHDFAKLAILLVQRSKDGKRVLQDIALEAVGGIVR